MKKLLLALLCLPLTLFAANWYVRPNSTGSNSGADWNNAWSASSIKWSQVSAGDTVWLAGGPYSSGITVSQSGAAGNPIKIYRATSSDSAPTSAAGWSSSFDSQVSLPGGDGIAIPSSSNITVDGRTQYGILITIGSGGGYGIECDSSYANMSNVSFYNIDVLGPYASPANPMQDSPIGCKISPSSGSLSNVLLDHCRIRGVGTGIHCLASNVTIQYCTIQDIAPANSTDHPDVMFCYPSPNMIWRYNYIINCTTDGVFFSYGGAANLKFYGNVYYSTTNHLLAFNGGASYGPVYIYNNTFQSPGTAPYEYGFFYGSGASFASGSQIYNNIFYNGYNALSGQSGIASDYNAYNYTTLDGFSWPSNEAHSFTFTGNPFVSLPPYTEPVATIGNFHLTPATQASFKRGISVTADGYINKDMDGNTRGASGAWYVGAYEYVSANPTPTPAPAPSPTPVPTPGLTASLFNAGSTPANLNWNDPNAVQLGVRFQTSTAGSITAIRFYKGVLDVGPHVATLWSSDGTLLASATFANETASGWQQVDFTTPVPITPGTTYTAAYHTNGFYSFDGGYFANAVTNGPLTAPANDNGVYGYGTTSNFPSNSYNLTNYWVDVVFAQ